MQPVETADVLVAIAVLIGAWWIRHCEPQSTTPDADTDLEVMLLGPYVTPPGHHDFLADRWSVIADVAVVVGLEQSLRRVQSGGRDGVA